MPPNNPAAFPLLPPLKPDGTAAVGYPFVEPGMSMRDYFAAKAMQGFAADPNSSWVEGADGMARCAYVWADAMLKARAA